VSNKILFFLFTAFIIPLFSEEMIIGKKIIQPGIELIFEGAPKDIIYPKDLHLAEKETDIHIEMLAQWADDNSASAPAKSFVAYLNVTAEIQSKDGSSRKIKLTPHLNLIDNLHYAQNVKLPGRISDLYDITFTISPPEKEVLGIHYDWNSKFGGLMKKTSFTFKDLDFKKIALKSRR
tara:strand:- start:5099 stop:5632 length:534 start_codon:yes stop_codon:yes gene_type:complete